MTNGAVGGNWQEGNLGNVWQVQVQTEEARAIRGCAGGLGHLSALLGRKAAGISRAGRENGRLSQGCSAQGDKGEEENSKGCGAEIEVEVNHALKFTVACCPCQEE